MRRAHARVQFRSLRRRYFVCDTKFASHRGETWVGRPDLQVPDDSRRQEVNVNPAYTTTMQVATANEIDDIMMRDGGGLMHALVGGQKIPAASPVANEEFSIDELVPCHFIETKKSAQLGRVGSPV
jgi:hypothetical protein